MSEATMTIEQLAAAVQAVTAAQVRERLARVRSEESALLTLLRSCMAREQRARRRPAEREPA